MDTPHINDLINLDISGMEVNDYNSISEVFDQIMGFDFLEAINDFWIGDLLHHLEKYENPRVLDLCCGTGLFLEHLGGKTELTGYGIDLSIGQIDEAKKRRIAKSSSANFQHGDICVTSYPKNIDLVTINFDSLNHLHDVNDWKNIFDKAFSCLNSGGIFAFDVNTPKRIKDDWDYPEVIVTEDFVYLHIGLDVEEEGSLVRRKTPMIIFVKDNGKFQRKQALVEQAAIPDERIMELLEAAGFANVSKDVPNEDQKKRHIFLKNRSFFTARKA